METFVCVFFFFFANLKAVQYGQNEQNTHTHTVSQQYWLSLQPS